LALQVTLFLTASKERKRGGGRYSMHPATSSAWTHATLPENPPLFLQFQKASSTIPGFLGICVVIFTCLNMYLNYCYIFFFEVYVML
jgi:hypothetical protein